MPKIEYGVQCLLIPVNKQAKAIIATIISKFFGTASIAKNTMVNDPISLLKKRSIPPTFSSKNNFLKSTLIIKLCDFNKIPVSFVDVT